METHRHCACETELAFEHTINVMSVLPVFYDEIESMSVSVWSIEISSKTRNDQREGESV